MGRKRTGSKGRPGPTRGQHRPGLPGTIRMTDRAGYVETAEGTFRLTGRGARGAMNGDKVIASLHKGPHGQRRAVVESVTEHAVRSIVGTYEQLGPLGSVRPLDARIREDFFVVPSDDSPTRLGVRPGDVVAARILTYPAHEESGVVTLERVVGGADAPSLGIECIMARYDLGEAYPDRALAEAEALSVDVEAALADPLRRDIRDRFLLTIDPVDARDFDDAISVARTPAGGWRLGVHIADVSHYVAWDGSVDVEARRRSTSVYLADRVLPMLPERLSNDLCSLRPGEDRLAMTVDMELDARGRVRSYEMFPSVIRSKVRLDYAAADAVLEGRAVAAGGVSGGMPDEKVALPSSYSGISEQDDGSAMFLDETGGSRSPGAIGEPPQTAAAPVDPAVAPADPAAERGAAAAARAEAQGTDLAAFLHDADDLARARRAIRHARGAIDFETVEVHALLDEEGLPTAITTRSRSAATSLIEEAMLLANECVAERLDGLGLDAAYRVHEPPSPDALAAAAGTLRGIGALTSQEASAVELGDPYAIERAVEAAHGAPFEALVNALLLRAMQRALYKPRNEGHFALGARAYCHFTSPIRRYPDLIVHRVLKMALARERLGARAARALAPALIGTGREALDKHLPQLCRHASERERVADAAATASQKVKVAQYYGSRIGETAAGAVSWIDQMGVFVRLDDTGAEGLLRLKELGGEWWDLDERTLTLTGSSTGRTIELGHRMVVRIARVDVLKGHLDLELVHAGRTLD